MDSECRDANAPLRPPAKKSGTTKTRSQIGDRTPTDQWRRYALEQVPDIDVDGTFLAFRDHHLKLGTLFADWDAAWRTWIRNISSKGFSYVRRPMGRDAEPEVERISAAEFRRREAAKGKARVSATPQPHVVADAQ